MRWLNKIIEWLTYCDHSWLRPKRNSEGKLTQTCYECGARKEIKADLERYVRTGAK